MNCKHCFSAWGVTNLVTVITVCKELVTCPRWSRPSHCLTQTDSKAGWFKSRRIPNFFEFTLVERTWQLERRFNWSQTLEWRQGLTDKAQVDHDKLTAKSLFSFSPYLLHFASFLMRYSVSSLNSPCVASPKVDAMLESLELRAVRSQVRSRSKRRWKEGDPAAKTNLEFFL